MKEKNRDSRIELLRILAMCTIVLSHFFLYGNWHHLLRISPINTVRLLAFDALGPAAAAIFFIITGFFFHGSKDLAVRIKISKDKIFKIWRKTFLYSILLTLLLLGVGISLSTKMIITSFLPIILNEYWFITCYIILILFSPFLDELINILDNKQLIILNSYLIAMLILKFANNSSIGMLVVAISGYLIGATIRINEEKILKIKTKYLLFILIFIYCCEILSIYGLRYIGVKFAHCAFFSQYLSAIIIASCAFILFLRIPFFINKTVNFLAQGVFAVYLITEQISVRKILWSKIVNMDRFQNSSFLYIISFITVIGIYCICSLFDIFISKILLEINNFKNK